MADKIGLNIHDSGFANELKALSVPISFIDFETFRGKPSPIPGTTPAEAIPCQWSNHILEKHGLDWDKNIRHEEFLWQGDWGFSPIYAFVESLYNSTKSSKTIAIYSSYEITCLKYCMKLADYDMGALKEGLITEEYVVVNAAGEKVPLMSIAPKIKPWCEEIIGKTYDMYRGPKDKKGGTNFWLQSPDFQNSSSIKKIYPVCMDEYSRASDILDRFGLPHDGYAGLASRGQISKGDECADRYAEALNRAQRENTPLNVPGAAPFNQNIASQCLLYCCLDTLSMVLIYLAVLEATEKYEQAAKFVGKMAMLPDGSFHCVEMSGDGTATLACDKRDVDPNKVTLLSQSMLDNLPVAEFYTRACKDCRRIEAGH